MTVGNSWELNELFMIAKLSLFDELVHHVRSKKKEGENIYVGANSSIYINDAEF